PIQEKTEIVQPIPNADPDDEDFDSLSEAVAAQDAPASLDSELNCLAVSVYYEAKSEPLAGQLAVADVILNRTESGRFPRSVCGVVTQR
ncbi:cell wall hydrolase, partial [Escherichia coli]|nr:cell wall hydrolase [Escherichia coli]